MLLSRVHRIALPLLISMAATLVAQQAGDEFIDERTLPEGPLGERARQIIDTINGEPEQVEDLVKNHFTDEMRDFAPLSTHVGTFQDLKRRTQGLELYSLRKYTPARPNHVLIARDKLTGSWYGIVFQIEDEPPHRISRLGFSPARPPKDAPSDGPAGPLTAEQALAELDGFVKKLASADVFSGAVLIGRGNQVLYTTAQGLANRSYDVPNKVDTKFNLGSMNKMITAVAIAQLADAGKLSYDDPASKHLDASWMPKSKLDKIKIKHLLTHTSGLGDYFNEEFMEQSREKYRDLDDYQEVTTSLSLDFEPGSRHRYSNAGYLLLGAIVAKASGQSYDDYVREHIYKPAGMTNTDAYEMDVVVPNLAVGYSREAGPDGMRWVSNLFKHVIKGGPAGGGFSTVEDMFAFSNALQNGKLVKPETYRLLTTPKPDENSPNYGYGFGCNPGSPLGASFGHSGGFPGIGSVLEVFPEAGWTIVVLTNADGALPPVQQKAIGLLSRVESSGRKAGGGTR